MIHCAMLLQTWGKMIKATESSCLNVYFLVDFPAWIHCPSARSTIEYHGRLRVVCQAIPLCLTWTPRKSSVAKTTSRRAMDSPLESVPPADHYYCVVFKWLCYFHSVCGCCDRSRGGWPLIPGLWDAHSVFPPPSLFHTITKKLKVLLHFKSTTYY